MLPTQFEIPAAIALLGGGAVACFAGYRLFRTVLAIYGFIAGAMLGSSLLGSGTAAGMVIAALAGGIIGAIVMFFTYFVGIALIGAGLGVFVFQFIWARLDQSPVPADPPWIAVLLCAAAGTALSLVLQKYVIVFSTAFAGAWSMILGGLSLSSTYASASIVTSNAWVLYPLTPIPGARWVPLAWVGIGVLGMVVQLGLSGKKK